MAEETVAQQILTHFFGYQAIPALEYVYRYAAKTQQTALRNQQSTVQAMTSNTEQQGGV